MKVRPSVKPMCEKCKIIKRKGKVRLSAKIQSTNKNKDNIKKDSIYSYFML